MRNAHSDYRRPLALVALLAGALFLGGCYEDAGDVTLYEPGEYKGEPDPLLDDSGTESFNEALRERFAAGQTDR